MTTRQIKKAAKTFDQLQQMGESFAAAGLAQTIGQQASDAQYAVFEAEIGRLMDRR